MATISLCMIVKNEERVLRRCLDSVHDLVDEIIIVDTGSVDSTKSIAAEYTDKIYDFTWIDDFSAARNFSFSKCRMEYIYVADADEYLDEENRKQFKILKDVIYSEIEIVQMMYMTVSNDTVLNVYKEYRPKLYKRLREFTWINPVHEAVRLDPLVFDSDIVVTHAPEGNHSKRDFSIFEKTIAEDGILDETLSKMYATELYRNGSAKDFNNAYGYFEKLAELYSDAPDGDIIKFSNIIILKCLRLNNDESFKVRALEYFNGTGKNISEVNMEIGEYYLENKDYMKAALFFNNAAYLSEAILDAHSQGDVALEKLILACETVISQYASYKESNGADEKMEQLIREYNEKIKIIKNDLANWSLPEEDSKTQ